MIFVGIVLVLAGAFVMAWSRRLSRVDADGDDVATVPSVTVFLIGCVVVAVGAVMVTAWWVSY